MSYYNRILKDLQRVTPVNPIIIPDPYDPTLSIKENVEREYHRLLRSIRSRNRIISLVNAYYLGKITETYANTVERSVAKKILTRHYADVCKRVFLLFEPLGLNKFI